MIVTTNDFDHSQPLRKKERILFLDSIRGIALLGILQLGTEIKPEEAMPGDLILFTGQNAKKRVVGHMGIVTDNPDGHLSFIHSSSGHKRGVHISELQGYYKTRLVKIVRIFPLASNMVLG